MSEILVVVVASCTCVSVSKWELVASNVLLVGCWVLLERLWDQMVR